MLNRDAIHEQHERACDRHATARAIRLLDNAALAFVNLAEETNDDATATQALGAARSVAAMLLIVARQMGADVADVDCFAEIERMRHA